MLAQQFRKIISSQTLKNTLVRGSTAVGNRQYSIKNQVELENDIKFDELQEKIKNKEVTIIDNRMPQEANERGIIPGALLVPINPMAHIMMSDPQQFKEDFGVEKPKKDDPIVTMCKLGVRARTAQMVLRSQGYTNVRVYVGSFEEWHRKGGDYVIPDPPIKYNMEFENVEFKF